MLIASLWRKKMEIQRFSGKLQDMRYLLDPVQFTPKRESDRHLPLLDPVQFTQLRSRSIYTPTQLRSTSPYFRPTLVDSNQIDAVSDRRLFACSTSPCFRSSFPAPCSDRLAMSSSSRGLGFFSSLISSSMSVGISSILLAGKSDLRNYTVDYSLLIWNCHKASIGVTTTQNRGQAGRRITKLKLKKRVATKDGSGKSHENPVNL
ncbi:hypothetical protein LXL04_027134 [Taraxacum kok-saghyz]